MYPSGMLRAFEVPIREKSKHLLEPDLIIAMRRVVATTQRCDPSHKGSLVFEPPLNGSIHREAASRQSSPDCAGCFEASPGGDWSRDELRGFDPRHPLSKLRLPERSRRSDQPSTGNAESRSPDATTAERLAEKPEADMPRPPTHFCSVRGHSGANRPQRNQQAPRTPSTFGMSRIVR